MPQGSWNWKKYLKYVDPVKSYQMVYWSLHFLPFWAIFSEVKHTLALTFWVYCNQQNRLFYKLLWLKGVQSDLKLILIYFIFRLPSDMWIMTMLLTVQKLQKKQIFVMCRTCHLRVLHHLVCSYISKLKAR